MLGVQSLLGCGCSGCGLVYQFTSVYSILSTGLLADLSTDLSTVGYKDELVELVVELVVLGIIIIDTLTVSF